MTSAKEKQAKELRLLIAINERLPAGVRCEDYIAELKVKLARLQAAKPKLQLATDAS